MLRTEKSPGCQINLINFHKCGIYQEGENGSMVYTSVRRAIPIYYGNISHISPNSACYHCQIFSDSSELLNQPKSYYTLGKGVKMNHSDTGQFEQKDFKNTMLTQSFHQQKVQGKVVLYKQLRDQVLCDVMWSKVRVLCYSYMVQVTDPLPTLVTSHLTEYFGPLFYIQQTHQETMN